MVDVSNRTYSPHARVDAADRDHLTKVDDSTLDLEANYVTPVCPPCIESYTDFSSSLSGTDSIDGLECTDTTHGANRNLWQEQIL